MIKNNPAECLFGVWFAVGLFIVPLGVRLPFGGMGDYIFMVLASLVVTTSLARDVGVGRALLVFTVIGLLSGAVEMAGALTGDIFGGYFYTDRFGPMFDATLSIAIPLAWVCIIVPLLALCRTGKWWSTCVLVATCAVAIDFVLEPLAFHVRKYWIWTGLEPGYLGVPWQNFVAWWGLAFLLALLVYPFTVKKAYLPAVLIRGSFVLGAILFTFSLALLVNGYFFPALWGVILIGAIVWGVKRQKAVR